MKFEPSTVGWRIGRSQVPHGVDLWQPWDRTAGVIGPQGSGKTLDLLTPALLQAPGAALVTLTKPDDLLLTITARQAKGPVAVLDPFGAAPGLPELIWDPIAGCIEATVAEKRAKAFCAGTLKNTGDGDNAARFYAAEAAKVIQCYFHAAALAGLSLNDVLAWAANPRTATLPGEILRTHPYAEPNWYGLLAGAISNADERTSGNTKSTVDQALALFATRDRRERCVPSPGRPAIDIADLIRNNGTIYLLGREDPYVSASPLMTAVAEHVLDTALHLAHQGGFGRLCPPMLACLDELPSTAPLPTLATRMANERAMGISFIWASQTWRQLVRVFGEQQARSIKDLTNTLVVFGGSKDASFNKEISDLLGSKRVTRRNHQLGGHRSFSTHGEDVPVIRPEQLRELPSRSALVIAENGKPILARLRRAIDGTSGRRLLSQQRDARLKTVAAQHPAGVRPADKEALALHHSRQLGLSNEAEIV
ncbi:type IV secretory system conjugative DNA transfer family protein [Tessaracoccus sp. MC1756]|uniref:type IV secretory system conjugative DNA transfer family protein n=1 Tax=Tessaracoccus sp. MC1756 TaxID=2760311 RepID=UPI0016001B89|nr:TraM recognition domain-containing protein [Tessaracoccus sp. MC1756]MBB1510640.1 type IV secretory system conjugative DNA transfer family protein [Tessaracoccus sp. MC1756]